MKKRFLSVLVAAAMVFALTPVLPVGADDGYIEIEKISHPGRGCCTDGRPLTAFASNVNALGPGSNSNNIWVEGKTRVAVTSDGSDNIAEVLFALNSTEIYWVNIPDNISLQDLSGYDILFINCGTWFFMSGTNLRAYVEQGGIIYASDFALGYIQDAFPERNITRLSLPPQHTVANIVNPVLQAATGLMQINVFFDLENWRLVNSPLQNDVDVHLTGTVTGGGSTPGMIYPFTFSFEHGENGGMVFFTSFHQRANNTIGMRTILENLVLNLSLTNDINNLNSWVANPNNNYNNMFPMPGMLEDGKGEIILGDAPEGGGFAVVNADTKGEFTLTLTAPNGTTYTNYNNGQYIVNGPALATAPGNSSS
ncbi:MAG: hypothetical protein FWE60_04690, partial [Oscillospiraceae bacterium]|nr:hypothetical protein [Oscillospiraceae bacterium]